MVRELLGKAQLALVLRQGLGVLSQLNLDV
jgi:hypothetical protein